MDGKIITARKRSSDPQQEKLRENKALWNRSATNLIAKLIAFKRGLNGRGDPRVGLPPSTIKEPLPPAIGQYLGGLADEYLSVIKGAEQIISEQAQYSESRRQPQTAPGAAPMLADDGLTTEASWWGSRYWAKSFGLTGESKKEMSRILDATSDLRKFLLDLENTVSSSDPNAIPDAFHTAVTLGLSSYNAIVKNLDIITQKSNLKISDTPAPEIKDTPSKQNESEVVSMEPAVVPTMTAEELASIQIDWDLVNAINKDFAALTFVLNVLRQTKTLNESQIKPLMDNLFIHKVWENERKWNKLPPSRKQEVVFLYKQTVDNYELLRGMAQSALQTPVTSFREMQLLAKELLDQTKATKNAHNSLTRFLKRKWLERPIFRDVVYGNNKVLFVQEIEDLVKFLDIKLDKIESGMSVDDLFSFIQVLSTKLSHIYESILILAQIHNNEYDQAISHGDQGRKSTVLRPIRHTMINQVKQRMNVMQSLENKRLI